jgi:hypothetical protein
MLCRGLLIFTALSLVVANSASAADLCFRYVNTYGGTLVMQGVTLPQIGTLPAQSCQPVAMYEAVDAPEEGLGGAATGSICFSTSGTPTIVFQYTYDGCTGNYFESGICRLQLHNDLSLPTQSSSCRLTLGSGIFYAYVDDAEIFSCDSTQFPYALPGGGGGQCISDRLRTSPHRPRPVTPPSSGEGKAK